MQIKKFRKIDEKSKRGWHGHKPIERIKGHHQWLLPLSIVLAGFAFMSFYPEYAPENSDIKDNPFLQPILFIGCSGTAIYCLYAGFFGAQSITIYETGFVHRLFDARTFVQWNECRGFSIVERLYRDKNFKKKKKETLQVLKKKGNPLEIKLELVSTRSLMEKMENYRKQFS